MSLREGVRRYLPPTRRQRLEQTKDFPKDGPILIITDGMIEDHLDITHTHAYLLPKGSRLPFRTKGEVYYFDE